MPSRHRQTVDCLKCFLAFNFLSHHLSFYLDSLPSAIFQHLRLHILSSLSALSNCIANIWINSNALTQMSCIFCCQISSTPPTANSPFSFVLSIRAGNSDYNRLIVTHAKRPSIQTKHSYSVRLSCISSRFATPIASVCLTILHIFHRKRFIQ